MVWRVHRWLGGALLLATLYVSAGLAQDITNLGGDLTTVLTGHNAIQVGAPNIASRERLDEQLSGFPVFHRSTTARMGLGPRFINNSCAGCHVQNGKGPLSLDSAIHGGTTFIVKVALRGLARNGAPRPIPGVGLQLQDLSVSGKKFHNLVLSWEFRSGRYRDGVRYVLRKPRVSFSIPRVDMKEVVSSMRMSPLLIGLGLVEAIPEEEILAKEDGRDSNRDGISGRANYVIDVVTKQKKLGRFGFKASQPSLAQQSAVAAISDMGLTNKLFPGRGGSRELSDDEFDRLVLYQQIAGVPRATNQNDSRVIRGKELFQKIGCVDCHTMTFVTAADAPVPEVREQIIHPFSDFLLHDMGTELADGRAEFNARGSEWRTTPLWGVGFAATLSDVRPLYLHDGRARTLEEAILWHGGEAQRSQSKFVRLGRKDRDALIRFLRSL